MLLSGTVFINRGNNAQAVKSLDDAGNLIKKNKISTWMFPEGTRHLSAKSDMLPLKKGGFHLAVSAGIPIIPIVVENYYHIYHSGLFGEGTIKVRGKCCIPSSRLLYALLIKKLNCILLVLPPIPTVGLTSKDAGELSIRVREQMVETLHEISTHATRPTVTEKMQEPMSVEQKPLVAAPESVIEPTSPATSSASALGISSSSASIVSSVSSRSSGRASENGAETEEDEGMVLVGRPSNQ
jgi:lysophosphatidate acyltransferase